jgi:hypothetical protein
MRAIQVPVVEPEGEVVQPAVRPGDHGQVVGRVRALQPDADLVAVAVQQLLGEPESQRLHVEPGGLAHLLRGHQDVVDARRGDAAQLRRRGRRRVDLRQQAADPLDLADQLHELAGGRLEADRLALADGLAAGDPAHREAVGLDAGFEHGQVLVPLDLEADQVEADAWGISQLDGMMVGLVPALEVDLGGGPLDLKQAEHLGVVGGGQIQIGHAHVHVRQAEDPHCSLLRGCRPGGTAGE